jgi:hypothetical protein
VIQHQDTSRSMLWRALDRPGMEFCQLRWAHEGTWCRGTVLLMLRDAPAEVSYSLRWDADWMTQWVGASITSGVDHRAVHLEVDQDRRWWVRSYHFTPPLNQPPPVEIPALYDLIDIDLSVTPLTNTLSVRRLNLKVGESAEVTAA